MQLAHPLRRQQQRTLTLGLAALLLALTANAVTLPISYTPEYSLSTGVEPLACQARMSVSDASEVSKGPCYDCCFDLEVKGLTGNVSASTSTPSSAVDGVAGPATAASAG